MTTPEERAAARVLMTRMSQFHGHYQRIENDIVRLIKSIDACQADAAETRRQIRGGEIPVEAERLASAAVDLPATGDLLADQLVLKEALEAYQTLHGNQEA